MAMQIKLIVVVVAVVVVVVVAVVYCLNGCRIAF